MHKTITVNGQEYDLQISARKEEGAKSISMDDKEVHDLYDEVTGIIMETMNDFRAWFRYHSKNLTKKQEYKIDELYNAVADMLLDGKFGTAEEGEDV